MDHKAQKILFTGYAKENDAIEALNEGRIDSYLNKTANKFVPKINIMVEKRIQAYFKEESRFICETMKKHDFTFFEDSAFQTFFEKQKKEIGFHTHCLISSQGSFYLQGDAFEKKMIVFTEDEYEMIQNSQNFEDLCVEDQEKLVKRTHVVDAFHILRESLSSKESEKKKLCEATLIQGEKSSYYVGFSEI